MSSTLRSQVIDSLIRSGRDVTEQNIDAEVSRMKTPKSIESILNKESGITSKTLFDIHQRAVDLMAFDSSVRESVLSDFSGLRADIDSRVQNLHRLTSYASSIIAEAKVLERNMSGHLNTINIDLGNDSVTNLGETNATVMEGVVWGMQSKSSKSDKSRVVLETYPSADISVTMSGASGIAPGRVEEKTDVAYIAPNSDVAIINSEQEFRIVSESSTSGSKVVEILIDRKSNSLFNQIEFDISVATMMDAYVSEDGLEFTKITDRQSYVRKTSVPVGNRSARYVKISLYKNSHDQVVSGMYSYETRFKSLNLVKMTLNESAVFETNPINIGAPLSALALSTCDNYSDPEVSIEYYVSIDDGDWHPIRPVDKKKVGKVMTPSVVRSDSYTENKLISLINFEKQGDKYISELNIPADFIQSNSIKVYSGDISSGGLEWSGDIYKKSYGYLKEPKVIDFGPNEIIINGKAAQGEVKLHSGLYEFSTHKDNYLNIYNSKKATLINSSNGEYSVKSEDGGVRVIADPLYPYNHKFLVETALDLTFRDLLIENEDYTLYNNGTSYNLMTPDHHDEVIAAFRLNRSNADNVRVRAVMKSINKTTIPYVERILIRMT